MFKELLEWKEELHAMAIEREQRVWFIYGMLLTIIVFGCLMEFGLV